LLRFGRRPRAALPSSFAKPVDEPCVQRGRQTNGTAQHGCSPFKARACSKKRKAHKDHSSKDLEQARLQLYLGSWAYSEGCTFFLSRATKAGKLRFDERLPSQHWVQSELEWRNGWFQGRVVFVDSSKDCGIVRLRHLGRDMLISNFQLPGHSQWGVDVLGYKIKQFTQNREAESMMHFGQVSAALVTNVDSAACTPHASRPIEESGADIYGGSSMTEMQLQEDTKHKYADGCFSACCFAADGAESMAKEPTKGLDESEDDEAIHGEIITWKAPGRLHISYFLQDCPASEFNGAYVITQDKVAVTATIDPDNSATVYLRSGTRVNVLQTVHVQRAQCIQARIEEPSGWITMAHVKTGECWVARDASYLTTTSPTSTTVTPNSSFEVHAEEACDICQM